MQHKESSNSMGAIMTTLPSHLTDFIISNLTAYEFVDTCGHTNTLEETLHGFNSFQGCSLGIGEVVGHMAQEPQREANPAP